MGYLVPALCQTRKVGSPTQKAVLMALASYAWDDGSSIWVSKATLAADLEMGHRTIQVAIKELVEKGLLIEVGERQVKHGFSIEYRIDLDAVEALERTRDPRKKTYKEGRSSCTPSSKRVQETAQTGAADDTNGCRSCTQSCKEYINPPNAQAQAREADFGFSEEFWNDLLKALHLDPQKLGKWWSGKAAQLHVAGWLALGLSESQILTVARKSRERQPEAPQGPKALDGVMSAAARQPQAAPPASHDEMKAFWAEKLNTEAFVAPSSISVAMATDLIRSGLVPAARLRSRGIAYSAP